MKLKNHLSLITILLFISTSIFSQWNQIGQDIKGISQYQQMGNKTAISGDGNRILVYSLLTENNYPKGKIQVFDFVDNNWQEIFAIENINDATSNSISDAKIDISNNGKVIAFSFYQKNEYTLNAYIYSNTTKTFSKYGVDINPRPNDASGNKASIIKAISLDETGNTLAVASFYKDQNDNDTPHSIVDVYRYETLNWVRKGQTLESSSFYTDPWSGEYFTSNFGNDIDLSGDGNTLLVGEKAFPKENKYLIGRVTAYSYTDNEWNIIGNQILGTYTTDGGESFGSSVCISNNGQRIAVGSSGIFDKLESTAKVYKLNNTTWEQIGNNLKVRGSSSSKFDGVSDISLNEDGSVIALSNISIRTSAFNILGALAVYQYKNSQWLQRSDNKLGQNHQEGFPGYVSISNNGKRVITSASYNGDNAAYSGKVFVFENEAVIDKTLNSTYVPDNNFEQALIDLGYDTELDDYVITDNINTVTSLNLENKNISDLTGLEAFTKLANLNIDNNNLTNINISKNINLTYLYCSKNNLTSLDLSKNIELLQLNYTDNNITSIDLSFNSKLQSITASRNDIALIDVSKQKDLDWLILNENFITEIDLSFTPKLRTLNISNNRLSKIEIKNNIKIETININNNFVQSINITGSINLKTLKTENNQLSSLDLSTNTSLENLFAKNNSLDCIQVSDVNYANVVWSSHTDSDVSFSRDCSNVWTIDVDPTVTTVLQSISGLDTNNDGSITLAEAAALTGTLDLSNKGIIDIKGLRAFTGISTLNLSDNSISDLSDLTGLKIEIINRYSGKNKKVNAGSMALEKLIIRNNTFETLNLEAFKNLKVINISNNLNLVTMSIKNGNNANITSFDATNSPNLTCIIVDDKDASYLQTFNKDANSKFVDNTAQCRQEVLEINNFTLDNFAIYPNPVSKELNVNSKIEFKAIEVYNVLGKRLLKTTEKKIDFSKFNSGIYLLRIFTDHKILTKRIVKE